MENQHFLTIGQLGKLSNVHVKALRYYEKIGILLPSRVDAQTGYRYYSYAHIPYVRMIKLCAAYEIPLQTFREFVSDQNSIDLEAILKLARTKILAKLAEAQADLDQVAHLQARIEQSRQIDQAAEICREEGPQTLWLLPFDGEIFDRSYYRLMAQSLEELQAVNCQTRHKVGLHYDLASRRTHLAIQVPDHHSRPDKGSWLELPAGPYRNRHIQAQAIAELLPQIPAPFCFVWETYEQDYRLTQPHLEISYPASPDL